MKLVVSSIFVTLLLAKLIIFAEVPATTMATTMATSTIANESMLEQMELEGTYTEGGLKTFVKRYEKLNVRIPAPSFTAMPDDEEEEVKEEEEDVHIDYGDEEDEMFESQRRGSFRLDALGEHFKVSYVRRSPSIFTADAVVTIIDDDGQRRHIDLETVTRDYIEGHLITDPDSHVYGDLSSGFFDGVIVTVQDTYYFEAADKYFRRPNFNAIAYRASDVTMCPSGRSTGSCSLDKEPSTSRKWPATLIKQRDYGESEETLESKAVLNGKQCRTMIVVDHTFMAGVARNSEKNAINEVNIHMRASDKIFRATDFDNDEQPDGIGLQVARLQVIKRKRGYPLEGVFTDPDAFLKKVAEYNLEDFCSGFVFTFRNMRGVLGASYLGVPTRGVDGGICATRKRYKEYGNKELNLNSGFASFKYADHDKVVPRGRSICTVAHEFGHLFGSPHDDTNEEERCNPPRHEDKYLMATKRAVDARITARNQIFSSCSCDHIRKFIRAKGQCLN